MPYDFDQDIADLLAATEHLRGAFRRKIGLPQSNLGLSIRPDRKTRERRPGSDVPGMSGAQMRKDPTCLR
jgi:hypothetical protein